MTPDNSLSGDDIKRMVQEKLQEYEELNPLEQYALFMGKAQILELSLKGLLGRRYDVDLDSMEKWTLGKVKSELEQRELRSDFIANLTTLVGHRNHMAHEFLANNALTRSIANFSERTLYGDLFRAIYELEQIIILYDWCEEHDGW